jgi:VWFA-related protein
MAVLWAVALGAAALAAGGRASAQQPSFRVSTELVVVDVSVLSRDGTPVKGLEASDFTVRVDGQPRRVRSIKFIDQSTSAPGGAATAASVARFSSNEAEATGRLILIVVDELSIGFGGLLTAAQSVEKLLAGFGPADKIGIATFPGPRMVVDFTRDRARVAAGLKSITAGIAPASGAFRQYKFTAREAFAVERNDTLTWQQVFVRECGVPAAPGCDTQLQMEMHLAVGEERSRTSEFVSSLRALLRALAAVDAPKLLILFSEGFASPEAASEMAFCGPEATAARAVLYGMRLDRSMFDVSAKTTMLSLPNGTEDRQSAMASLDALAGSARGTVFDIIGSADIPFRRLATEVSGYYLLGVEPEGSDRDGKLHQVRVDVSRPGLTVRARREFASRPAAAKNEKNLLATTLGLPLAVSDIPLRVATFVSPDEDPARVRVLVVGEVDRSQPKDGSATVAFVFTDEKGKTSATQPQRMTLPRLDSGALSLILSTPLAPGSYTMKVAVVREGQAGSVEHHFDARLTGVEAVGTASSTPVQIGELVVAAAPTAAAQKLVPSLEGLVRGDQFISFVQVAVDPKSAERLSLTFDVVKEEHGPALLSTPGFVDAAAAKTRVHVALASVDAGLLPPGDYGIRLTVASGAKPFATLFTPFSLERPRPTLDADSKVIAKKPGGPPAPSADAARFRREDVLAPAVLAPFLEEVARYSPATARPALELARTGRLEEALQQAQPAKPGDPVPAFLRGLSLLSKGELDPAAEAFRQAIAISPELLVGAFYIGACYAAGNRATRDTSAINAWQTSLVALDRYPAVYRFMADAMFRLGQSERARQLLADALARWPDDGALRARAAQATFETGRYEQALENADRVIEREPKDTSVLFLAMRSAFQALIEEAAVPPGELLSRLRRYRDLYVAAGGLQQALVDEWVRYAEKKAGA